jgi:hypothetical protein
VFPEIILIFVYRSIKMLSGTYNITGFWLLNSELTKLTLYFYLDLWYLLDKKPSRYAEERFYTTRNDQVKQKLNFTKNRVEE